MKMLHDWKILFFDVICLENKRFMEHFGVTTCREFYVVIGEFSKGTKIVFVGLNCQWKLKHSEDEILNEKT